MMRRSFRAAWAATILLLIGPRAQAERGLTFQVLVGAPYNLPTPLVIKQSGQPDLHIDARYESRAFRNPPFYDLRAGWRQDKGEWALELVHHKLFLIDPPPEVQTFAITHGFNLIELSHARELPWNLWGRAGAAMVLTHPESTIRQLTLAEDQGIFGKGFYVSGAALTLSLEERIHLVAGLFLVIDGLASAAYAVVPVADGHARVPNVAVYGLGGLGYSLAR